jgi:cyclohexyl-isocyanide hydratase
MWSPPGGVTSGIDFALSIVAALADEPTARKIQLGIEYDPNPPFDSGSPDQVAPDLKAAVLARSEAARSSLQAIITELRAS